MSKAKWTDEFNHDLLTFPPLMWVSKLNFSSVFVLWLIKSYFKNTLAEKYFTSQLKLYYCLSLLWQLIMDKSVHRANTKRFNV